MVEPAAVARTAADEPETAPVEVIDLVAAEAEVGDDVFVDLDEPSPPRLVTAADLGAEGAEAVDPGPATMPVPVIEETPLFEGTEPADEDPFLAQLRDAVAEGDEPSDDDALSAFFDHDEEDGRSWFGRRR